MSKANMKIWLVCVCHESLTGKIAAWHFTVQARNVKAAREEADRALRDKRWLVRVLADEHHPVIVHGWITLLISPFAEIRAFAEA